LSEFESSVISTTYVHHDTSEILLKLSLNTNKLNNQQNMYTTTYRNTVRVVLNHNQSIIKIYTPCYIWNTATVSIKHPSINQSTKYVHHNIFWILLELALNTNQYINQQHNVHHAIYLKYSLC